MARTRHEPLVRLVSPFGSPAWMPRERALRHVEEDDRRWCRFLEIEAETGEKVLSDRERQIGPPHIQTAEDLAARVPR